MIKIGMVHANHFFSLSTQHSSPAHTRTLLQGQHSAHTTHRCPQMSRRRPPPLHPQVFALAIAMSGVRGFLYNSVFKRNSTYAAFIVAGAVVGENFVHKFFDNLWEDSNKGVSLHPAPALIAPC